MKIHEKFLIMVVCLSLGGCFGGIDKRGSVKSYADGTVKTIGGGFRIGILPESWKEHKINPRAVLFRNDDAATITVSSWCRRAFDDGTPETLSEELYSALAAVRVLKVRTQPIDGAEARVTVSRGEMDGKPVYLKTYVLKKRGCVFDFVYVTAPDRLGGEKDFDALASGFRYLKGPGVL